MVSRFVPEGGPSQEHRIVLCVHSETSRREDLQADLEEILPPDYRVVSVTSSTDGLEILHDLEKRGQTVDIVISDMGGPDLPGDRFLEIVNGRFPVVRKLLLTEDDSVDSALYSINNAGLDRFLRQPFSREDLRLTVQSLLRLCRLRSDNEDLLRILRQRNIQLEEMLQSLRTAHGEVETSYLQTLQALAMALEAKDHYTAGHSGRVSRFAYLLARRMGLARDKCEEIRNGALMHDIGKIGVPERVLMKPDRLSEDEVALIQMHPVTGAQILDAVPPLRRYIHAVRHHHERWDGKGYPDGLKGNEIPIEARITLIADTFDAITSDRPYRPAKPLELAVDQFKKFAGMQFDSECVQVFLQILEEDPPALMEKAAGATLL
jgi:putative nucleotidyltransferase with HDIG domain